MSLVDKINELKQIVNKIRIVNFGDIIKADDDNLKTDAFKKILEILNLIKDVVPISDLIQKYQQLTNKLYYVKDCPLPLDECIKYREYQVSSELHNTFLDLFKTLDSIFGKIVETCPELRNKYFEYKRSLAFLDYRKSGDLILPMYHNTQRDALFKLVDCFNIINQYCLWIKKPLTFKFFPFHYIGWGYSGMFKIVESDYVNDIKCHTCTYDVQKGDIVEDHVCTFNAYIPCFEDFAYPTSVYAKYYIPAWYENNYRAVDIDFGYYDPEQGDFTKYHFIHKEFYKDWELDYLKPEKYIYIYVYVRIEGKYITRITIEFESDTGNKIPVFQIIWKFLNKDKVEIRIKHIGRSGYYIILPGGIYLPASPTYDKLNLWLFVDYYTIWYDYEANECYGRWLINGCFDYSIIVRYLSDFDCWIPDFEYSTTPTIEDYSNDILLYSNTLHDVTIEQVGILKYFDEKIDLALSHGDCICLTTKIYFNSEWCHYEWIGIENDYSDKYFHTDSHGKLFLGKEDDVVKRVTIETTEGYVVQYIYNPNNVHVNCKAVKDCSGLVLGIGNDMSKYFKQRVLLDERILYYSPRFPNLYMTYKLPLQHIPDEVIHIS